MYQENWNEEKLYIIYISPLFEYTADVLKNCGAGNFNNFKSSSSYK